MMPGSGAWSFPREPIQSQLHSQVRGLMVAVSLAFLAGFVLQSR